MALNDLQHVEAVAIMRNLVEQTREYGSPSYEAIQAGEIWLKGNHPEPSVYMAAVRAAAPHACPDCEPPGSGKQTVVDPLDSSMSWQEPCIECDGTGVAPSPTEGTQE